MTIGICGSGTMGRGIAIASLTAGHSVVFFDIADAALEAARKNVVEQLHKAVEKGKLSADACAMAEKHIVTSTSLDAMAKADIVIEAVAEQLTIKHALFTQLERVCSPDAILTSNTSSISIASLARCLNDPLRFAGLHFFNPAHIMKLVEVIKGPRTSDAVITTCVAFAKGLGKTPVVATDAPGFIVNRVARNYYNEAQRIVMEGAATIPQIDTLMKGLGFKMGPFELMDLIGVDVNLDVTKSQWEQFFHEPRFTPSLLQQQYVDAGLHGKKTDGGFYSY
ncbi:MAG: 3-hydroxyacyl-CoA dehydrogenase NAD-binding domain-containing protein [Candidatus Kapabacteria bacterium]|nr:3-hydroxyacyl-CoA dehydrogenase NAD-binding domain-containing protein [Candidatus Kapabacteria bacterium]